MNSITANATASPTFSSPLSLAITINRTAKVRYNSIASHLLWEWISQPSGVIIAIIRDQLGLK